ncbi:MAG: hypothetical protein ACK4NB_04900 [Fimbriimonadales bacterium]
MEPLSPQEYTIVERILEELKEHPRLVRPLQEALGIVALLGVPAQLDSLIQIIEQLLARQAEQEKRLERVEQTALEAKQAALEAKQEAREAKEVALDVRERTGRIEQRLDRIENDMGTLKGIVKEIEARKRAPAVFGRLFRKIRTYDLEQFMAIAEEELGLSLDDLMEVLNADFFVSAQLRSDGRPIWLVVEASWGIGVKDVERSHNRAMILRQAGLDAYGAVMGTSITRAARQRAQELNVLVALNGSLYNEQQFRP